MTELARNTLKNGVPLSIHHSYVINGFESTLHVPQQSQHSISFANVIIHLSSPSIAPPLFYSQKKENEKRSKEQMETKTNKQTRVTIPSRVTRTIPEHYVWHSYEGTAPINVTDELAYCFG